MGLNYISLQKAIVALEKGIMIYQTKKEQDIKGDEMEIIQSGIIQNFEVCYEISWKLMKKKLEENIGRTEVDGVSRKELFRIAARNKLIDDVEKWFVFHEARNMTSHDYDGIKADEVFRNSNGILTICQKINGKVRRK